MKIFRSGKFKTSDPLLWEKTKLIIEGGGGSLFFARSVFTGFEIKPSRKIIGPFTLRNYDQSIDKIIGLCSGRACVVELKFEDRNLIGLNSSVSNCLSMYVEPFWLMYSFYLGLQIFLDSWVGMMPIYYYNKNDNLVGNFGGTTEVADSRSINFQPIWDIYRFPKKELLQIINAQYGRCSLAIDRFSKACQETAEESIVDFIIALESLLGIGLGRELSHRICSRAAFLLSICENQALERENYYYALKYLYGLRSKIVHGSIDEIVPPSKEQKKQKLALQKFQVDISGLHSWELRFPISEFARSITRKIILFFIKNENKLNANWLTRLELGMEK